MGLALDSAADGFMMICCGFIFCKVFWSSRIMSRNIMHCRGVCCLIKASSFLPSHLLFTCVLIVMSTSHA